MVGKMMTVLSLAFAYAGPFLGFTDFGQNKNHRV
jgi:hypothetical protein